MWRGGSGSGSAGGAEGRDRELPTMCAGVKTPGPRSCGDSEERRLSGPPGPALRVMAEFLVTESNCLFAPLV